MKSLVVANWKMNPSTFAEAKTLLDVTRKAAEKCANISLIVAPPAIYTRSLIDGYRGAKIAFALQDAQAKAEDTRTGAISIEQGKDAGASYVIVGHAECRALGVTNDHTRIRVATALRLGMVPILCVGERLRSNDGEHFAMIREQICVGLADAGTKIKRVIIAYEPVWAIGAREAMLPRDMHEMAIFIRKTIVDAYGDCGHTIKIVYGGSVDETNACAMLQEGGVRGLLIGRASYDVQKCGALLNVIEHA